MRRYKEGANREQAMLFPPRVEDYVGENNPVRAIDCYVESLALEKLGFTNTAGGVTCGQRAFPPGCLLKMYLYGYINRVRSSRGLEREAHRNIELIWLLEDLKPCYKTIADFRKNNGAALQNLAREFVLLCKEVGLLGGELVAIDGSFFKGNASKKSIRTKKQLKAQLKRISEDIKQYEAELSEQDRADEEHSLGSVVEEENLTQKLEALKERKAEKDAELTRLKRSGEKQLSRVDQDARKLYKGGATVAGFNVQTSVDAKHKLLIHVEVTNEGNDKQQLLPQALQSKEILGVETLTVVADTGYYKASHIKDCLDEGITPIVTEVNNRHAEEGFERKDFPYDEAGDCYLCPAGERLQKTGTPVELRGRLLSRYKSDKKVCHHCPFVARCIKAKSGIRTIDRWEHEQVIEAHRERMKTEASQTLLRERGQIVEHPFGTIKRWCGMDHFLVRGFEKVAGEMSLLVTCYNLTRVLNIIGIEQFRRHCQQRRESLVAL